MKYLIYITTEYKQEHHVGGYETGDCHTVISYHESVCEYKFETDDKQKLWEHVESLFRKEGGKNTIKSIKVIEYIQQFEYSWKDINYLESRYQKDLIKKQELAELERLANKHGKKLS